MKHPYEQLPTQAYWRKSVSAPALGDIDPATEPQFKIGPTTKVATAGSCFAQHIARHLVKAGLTYLITEAAHPIVPQRLAELFNYGIYTARYGNLYTARQFHQTLLRAYGLFGDPALFWKSGERYIDPYRPQIQPDGFSSLEELLSDREQHLETVRQAVETLDVMVFTLGLTECWWDNSWGSKRTGIVYPLCPGVVGGEFDASRHIFHNFSVAEVVADTLDAVDFIRERKADAKFILTVSPVPLIATASGKHVLQATTYSKAVLRTAAEQVAASRSDVEYFPSYEIITGAHTRGAYFAPDLRSVTEEGISHVMRIFLRHFCDIDPVYMVATELESVDVLAHATAAVRTVCEEEALDARKVRAEA